MIAGISRKRQTQHLQNLRDAFPKAATRRVRHPDIYINQQHRERW